MLSLCFSLYVVPTFPLQQGPFANPTKPLSLSYDLEVLSVPAIGMNHILSLFYLFLLLDGRRGKVYILMVEMWSEGHGLVRFVFYFFFPSSLLWPSLKNSDIFHQIVNLLPMAFNTSIYCSHIPLATIT